MAQMILFLLGLLLLLAYHLRLQARARRDIIDLAQRLIDKGQPVPPELLDRLTLAPERIETPRWLAPAFFLLLAVGFVMAGIDADDRGELDERLLLFGVSLIFLVISAITYAMVQRRE